LQLKCKSLKTVYYFSSHETYTMGGCQCREGGVVKKSHAGLPQHHQVVEEIVESHTHNNIDIDACLAAHNKFREKHGAPDLVWDDALSDTALKAAQACLEKGNLEHSNVGEGEGQNLYLVQTSGAPNKTGSKQAVADWYGEIQKYDFAKPGPIEGTDHFTQVIWVGTTKVGMAKLKETKDGKETIYIAANYSPAGNVKDVFWKNVLVEGSKVGEKPKEPEKPKEAEKPKEPEKQKEAEKPKEPEKQKEAEKPKEPEKQKEAEKPKEPEKQKEAEKPKEPEKPKKAEEPKK